MLGAIYGDIIGSYYEVHCTKEYDFPFQKDSTFTDDSVLNTATAKAILLNSHPITRRQLNQRSREYAIQYQQYYSWFPHAGYGNMFTEWASSHSTRRQRSYGNGGAMRVIPIGWAYDDIEQILLQAKASCLCTHNHHEAIQGAQMVAVAVFLARMGADKNEIRSELSKRFRHPLAFQLDDIRPLYEFDSRTNYSVPPAIVCFLESTDYESAVRNAVSMGGDADTMACIAGGIAEAYYKEIPDFVRKFCDLKIDSSIRKVIQEFKRGYCPPLKS
ncbi:MAG TPA: hypothetical protein DCO72_09200 [Ruminococcus sp.]|nr:hypothetical protein [Ruminococcus sp.]